MTKNLQRAAGKMPGGQELKEKKRNLVPVIVAEHNLVSDVSTSQVAEELAKEDERSDCEVGEGRGEEVTTSQSSASMQVLANVVVSCSISELLLPFLKDSHCTLPSPDRVANLWKYDEEEEEEEEAGMEHGSPPFSESSSQRFSKLF